MKRNSFVLCFISILIFILYCVFTYNNTATIKTEKIILGAELSALPSVMWVAEKNGYFKDQKLEIEIHEFDSGKTALKSMLYEGGIDIVTAAQAPVMMHSFNKKNYAIVAAMMYSDNDSKVIARKDSDITRPSDLKGKKIGVTVGSTGQYFLSLFLYRNGLQLSDVMIVDYKATELVQRLHNKEVDAIATWEPHVIRAQKTLGANAQVFQGKGLVRTDFYFVADKKFIQKKSAALTRFLKAIARAETFMQDHTQESITIVANRLHVDQQIIKQTFKFYKFYLMLDQSILITLESQARWGIKNGIVKHTMVPNYLDYVYFDALFAVKPDAVTIIH